MGRETRFGQRCSSRVFLCSFFERASIRLAASDGSLMASLRLAAFAGSDLLCYRATAPESLVKLQQDRWQPLLDWAAERHGARLLTADGIGFVEQPSEAQARLREAVAAHGDLALSALYNLTHIAGSVVIALAVSDGRLDAEEAFTARFNSAADSDIGRACPSHPFTTKRKDVATSATRAACVRSRCSWP